LIKMVQSIFAVSICLSSQSALPAAVNKPEGEQL
jgi:hypothetical protein